MSSFKSSSSKRKMIHDVFLNFRGGDTRRSFVSHLHYSLSNAGINTFLDEEKLEKGQMLRPELWRAIEGSKIYIVVFSKNYAQSSWCLDELVKIMECNPTIGQLVLPIFYDVDPSDVRYQKGTIGEALEGLAVRYAGMKDVVSGWKNALTQAANLVGWDVRNCKSESKVVNEIVRVVLEKLDDTYLSITDFPVGLESRVQDVTDFLKRRSRGVRIVGIWGMGGIGKTTIAKAIYNEIRSKFANKSFLANIREVWEKDRGQINLQKQLLLDICKTREMKIYNIEEGKAKIKKLCKKRALVVLDDVNKSEQLAALCGNRGCLGQGSVIIVTTRDLHLLKSLGVDHVYTMREMDENESLELFNHYAFMEASPSEDFIELSRNVVAYCGGLPLALEVLGSYLSGRTREEWESVLSRLERIPNDQIQEKLKISFDGLKDYGEKDIFLDICCFFIGMDIAYVTEILNGCGLYAGIGIAVLKDRALIKVDKNNKLGMHDLLRDMGREIVRQISPQEPGKRSRLWFHEDVRDVLTEHYGTEVVEGLALKLQGSSIACYNTKAFEKMKRLRLLQLDHVQVVGDYGFLPKKLKWIYWQGFPWRYTPDNFDQRDLVVMDLKHSKLKMVWKETKNLEKLKILNLSHSQDLTYTPDFSKLPSLEKLILKDCPSLSKVDESIGSLKKLVLLNLKDCSSLSNLPMTIYQLKSVKTLNLSGCSKIGKLEENIVQMESLTTLVAKKTAIRQVPFSIVRSKSIGYISLCEYEGLSRDVFPSLILSWMSPRMNSLSFIHPFAGISSSLVSMHVENENLGDLSPMLSSLSKLRSIWVQWPSEFQLTQDLGRIQDDMDDVNRTEFETTSYESQISKHCLRSLLIGMGSYHHVINTLSKRIQEALTACGHGDFSLPGNNYPCWSTCTGGGHSVLFEVSPVGDCHLKGMILCVVYSSTHENMAAECVISVLIINYTKCIVKLYKRDTVLSFNDEEWQSIVSDVGPHDKMGIYVACGHGLNVKKTAVYLIYGESVDGKTEPSLEPKNNSSMRPTKRMRMGC